MSPGSGVGPTRRANNLLLIFLPLTSAVVGSAGRGNVGKLLDPSYTISAQGTPMTKSVY